jgi:pimeloyl-ACP methyl ester carboxylesterase
MFALDGHHQPRATRTLQERVVLIHCSASSARQWNGLVEQLAGFEPVPLDLHGHGTRRRWARTGPLSLLAEAAAIDDACRDGNPFHLIGHSYGGAVALKFASGHPQRLRSLTLIEPSCFHLLKAAGTAEAESFDEIVAIANAVNRGVICGDYRRGMAAFIDYWGGEGTWANLSDARQAQFADLAVDVAHHFWSLINEDTPLSAYAAINVPTLILCGAHSPKPSRAITRLLAEALPRVWHRTIRNVNHMSPITHPGRVNPFILDHLLINRGKKGLLDQLIGAQ